GPKTPVRRAERQVVTVTSHPIALHTRRGGRFAPPVPDCSVCVVLSSRKIHASPFLFTSLSHRSPSVFDQNAGACWEERGKRRGDRWYLSNLRPACWGAGGGRSGDPTAGGLRGRGRRWPAGARRFASEDGAGRSVCTRERSRADRSSCR